jgi:Fe-S cluster biogenesis protein NfuA
MKAHPSSSTDSISAVIRDIIGPLIEADGGELYVLRADPKRVELHLAGRFSGCPGNLVTARRVLEPAIHAVAPNAEVAVSWGMLIPAGAERVRGS